MTVEERKNLILAKIEEIKTSGNAEEMADMQAALAALGVTDNE